MRSQKVAVVTGANKGIGNEVVRNLCRQFSGETILTSRDIERGRNAVAQINEQEKHNSSSFHPPIFHQLDVTDAASIERLRDYMKTTFNGLDILVNNAGVLLRHSRQSLSEQAEQTLATNFYGVLQTCRNLFALLRDDARVVNVASKMGYFANIRDAQAKQRLLSDDLSMPELESMMQSYIDATKRHEKGLPNESIWSDEAFLLPYGPYCVSKIGVIAMTRVLQRETEADANFKQRGILVNCCCPGYVDTDMTDHCGPRSLAEGADTPTYLALLHANENSLPKGELVYDRQVLDWSKLQHWY